MHRHRLRARHENGKALKTAFLQQPNSSGNNKNHVIRNYRIRLLKTFPSKTTVKKLTALLLFVLSASALAAAQAKPQALVFAYNAFAPWKTFDSQGQPAGPYTDIVRELARRMHLSLRFLPCPLSRCLAAMQNGKADLMIGVQNTPQRARYLDFLDPPFANDNRLAFYQRSGDSRDISHYADLLPLTVGVVEGVQYQPQFDADGRIRRDAGPTVESSFRKLVAGRVDVLIDNEQQSALLASSEEFAGRVQRARLTLDNPHPNRLALARHSPLQPEKAEFEHALRAMLADGTISRLLAFERARIR
ncbi:hypothetical protein QR66_13750 [Chromobacterium piscinae]|nr:hypothetical protein QR66_13750 [Chromobacterium piscinae]